MAKGKKKKPAMPKVKRQEIIYTAIADFLVGLLLLLLSKLIND